MLIYGVDPLLCWILKNKNKINLSQKLTKFFYVTCSYSMTTIERAI